VPQLPQLPRRTCRAPSQAKTRPPSTAQAPQHADGRRQRRTDAVPDPVAERREALGPAAGLGALARGRRPRARRADAAGGQHQVLRVRLGEALLAPRRARPASADARATCRAGQVGSRRLRGFQSAPAHKPPLHAAQHSGRAVPGQAAARGGQARAGGRTGQKASGSVQPHAGSFMSDSCEPNTVAPAGTTMPLLKATSRMATRRRPACATGCRRMLSCATSRASQDTRRPRRLPDMRTAHSGSQPHSTAGPPACASGRRRRPLTTAYPERRQLHRGRPRWVARPGRRAAAGRAP